VQAECVMFRVEGERRLSLGLWFPVDCWQVTDINSRWVNLPSVESFALYPNIYTLNQKLSLDGKFRANTAIRSAHNYGQIPPTPKTENSRTAKTETDPETG